MITVLVAVDLCEHSALTIEVANAIAQGARGRLLVLHVVELPERPEGEGEEIETEWSRLKSYVLFSAERVLESLLLRLGLSGKVEKRLRLGGSPLEAIVEEARTSAADLIVVGIHERPFVLRLLTGKLERKLQRRTHCPVVSVRSGTPEQIASRLRPKRIVIRAEALR